MKKLIIPALLICAAATGVAGERKALFNDGWTFSLAADSTAISNDFNDSGWQRLTLPHDWSILQPFDKDYPAGNDGGYLPTGTGWYRKTFNITSKELERKHSIYFEGAYMNTDVYVNGHKAGTNPYGYSSFFVDITPYLQEGKNTVAVRVDNSMQKNCRWYSGSGIFRNVWLMETGKVHIGNWGVKITTPDLTTADVRTVIENETSEPHTVEVRATIDGHQSQQTLTIKPGDSATASIKVTVPEAKAWSHDSPQLYTAEISVIEDGKVIDQTQQKFGFRTIAWSAEDGFLLNGQPVALNGACAHHDNGILGAAAFDDAERKRVQWLKEAGFNAVRTSHNIPSETFLNACDEAGLMVIDEAFDGWRDAKNTYDYHTLFDQNWQKDLDAMLHRDFNHPSIICWSVGNEVIERDKIEVVKTARHLVERCHAVDPSRPVTSALANWGMDWETYDPLAEQHDIVGYNYMIHESGADHKRDSQRVMMQTESFPGHAYNNYRWVKDNPYIVGDFVWTGLDYIGESGIGRYYYEGDVEGEHWVRPMYPWHGAYCGDIDLIGQRKPISHYRSMLWNPDDEHLYIAVKEPDGYIGKVKTTSWSVWPTFESWNWPGHEGKDIDVEVYSHYPTVRLYLDDKLIGEKASEEMKAVFTLPYQAGTLRAEGVADGAVKETRILASAGEVKGIRLTADRKAFSSPDGLAYILIEMVDKDGNVVPVADNELTVTVTGNGTLQALGNADIKDEDPYFDSTHKAWKGRALAVVRAAGKKGGATVKVASPGLKTVSTPLNPPARGEVR